MSIVSPTLKSEVRGVTDDSWSNLSSSFLVVSAERAEVSGRCVGKSINHSLRSTRQTLLCSSMSMSLRYSGTVSMSQGVSNLIEDGLALE